MSSDPNLAAKRQAWPVRWFPALWWLLLLSLYGLVRYQGSLGMDSDKVVVMTILLLNLAWLGPLVWAVTCWQPVARLSRGKRWLARLGAAAVVVAVFLSLDVDYDGDSRWRAVRFRWAADPDQRLESLAASNQADDWQTTPNDYPRFLGSGYWAEVSGLELADDWQSMPPKLLWKQPIGAGWSAFAIVGEYAVTQEQRGDDELVVCYRLRDGEVVWTHADQARHDPANVGGGLGRCRTTGNAHHPRRPRLHDGRHRHRQLP